MAACGLKGAPGKHVPRKPLPPHTTIFLAAAFDIFVVLSSPELCPPLFYTVARNPDLIAQSRARAEAPSMPMETPQQSHPEQSLGSVPDAQPASVPSAGNGVADNPHETSSTTTTAADGTTNHHPPPSSAQAAADPANATASNHGTPQQASPPPLNTPTHPQHAEKSDSITKHKRSNSSARPTPSRNTPTSAGIPTELIPAELRGDFAPGVWEPANQKRRAHSRNVSLALPSSPSSDEDSAARAHRRKSSQPVQGRKRSAPAPDSQVAAPPPPHQHAPQNHQREDAAPRKRTTAQHQHHSSQHLLNQHHIPARLHQHTQSLPNIDTSSRHRRTATLTSQPSTPYTATMVGLSDKKRVKGVKITRAFRIGSEAWKLDEKNRPPGIPEDHTTGWRVYVENVDGGPDISTWLNKVQFSLHETYPNNKRSTLIQPFMEEIFSCTGKLCANTKQ